MPEVIGYLNEVSRDATPVSLQAIFREGSQAYVIHGGQQVPIDLQEMENGVGATLFAVPKVISEHQDNGRVLVYEDILTELTSAEPPMVHEYLSPSAEDQRRSALYEAYLARAVRLFSSLPEAPPEIPHTKIDELKNELEHLARCKPSNLLARLVLMALAGCENNLVGFSTHLAELRFESSRA